MSNDAALRKQLIEQLTEARAHATFEDAVRDFPEALRGKRPAGSPHSAWEQLEHLRIAQWDILKFSGDGSHESPKWPEGYWPETPEPPDSAAWDASVKSFLSDREEMCDLVADPATDLFAPIPGGTDQTILREALLAADHNAYHIGQLLLIRRLAGAWKK